ncbi:MAG TPA: hypothetical protein ENI42_01810 [Thermoplasmatales archaeon]|nr:hypothetical protein [Thermoplasmatales archaeon]
MRCKMIILALIILLYFQTAQAYEELSIVKVDHHLINSRQTGDWTIRTFLINITLTNKGDETSEDTTVSIEDNEGFILHKNTTFNPGETKVISFEWTTKNPAQQVINISYEPTNKNIPRTSYNSGKTTLTIEALQGYEEKGKNTPGFEFTLLIATVLLVLVYKYKRREL